MSPCGSREGSERRALGGRRVNPARISAVDGTEIARRRVRLHAETPAERLRAALAGKLTLRLIAERAARALYVSGAATAAAAPRRSASHAPHHAILGLRSSSTQISTQNV